MNAITDTPTLTPAQSLRRQIDALSGDIQTKARQIETMTDMAADVLSEICGEPTERQLNHLVNLVDLALRFSREVADLGEQVETLSRHVPEAVA